MNSVSDAPILANFTYKDSNMFKIDRSLLISRVTISHYEWGFCIFTGQLVLMKNHRI